MIFTGRRVSSDEAKDIGLVNYVEKTHEDALEKAREIANIIGSEKGPIAIRAAKQAINHGINMDL